MKTPVNNKLIKTETQQQSQSDEVPEKMTYILTEKYYKLKNRVSLLDNVTQNTMMNKSIFKGLFNMIHVLAFIFIVNYVIMRYFKFGQILDQRVVLSLGKDFFICISTWPLLYIWSYNALILQKLIINGLNSKIAVLYQHLTQALMFMLVMFFIIEQQWSLTNTAYATIHTCVHFMKMHSYTQMNKYYREEWKQDQNQGQQTSSYPNNISFKNFTLYMWMPVLAYQIEYPRTDKFRIGFFLFKVFQVIICISLDYIIGIEFVIPYIELGDQIGGLQLMCYIVLPMTLFSMISFVLIFEATMNAFAEITYFGDRQFYQDWWNSTTYEEFNRKWNRCVYNFLFRHVYLELTHRHKFSKTFAQITTFIFSAVLHEWILILCFKIVRPIITLCMLQQIPLFHLTRFMKSKLYGNIFFWFGLIGGVPFIGINYLRSHPEVIQFYSQKGLYETFTFDVFR